MKTKILIVGIVLFIGYAVFAATTDNPSRSMVSALAGIQDAILSLTAEEPAKEKDWYHGHYKIEPAQNDALFAVPEGRQFVLLRLYSAPEWPYSTDWYLAANETSILDGLINKYSYEGGKVTYKYEHDFPDGCITVNTKETLNAVNNDTLSLSIMVVGYFRDMPL